MRLFFLLNLLYFFFFVPHYANALRVVDSQTILDKLEDYNMCQGRYDSGVSCNDALVRWVEKHPADAFAAGKMTRKSMNAWGAIPFFIQAFNNGKGDCKDKDVKLAVVSAVNLPIDSNKDIVLAAKKIGFEKCAVDLKEALIESAHLDSYSFKNICKELLVAGSIKGLKAKTCAALK